MLQSSGGKEKDERPMSRKTKAEKKDMEQKDLKINEEPDQTGEKEDNDTYEHADAKAGDGMPENANHDEAEPDFHEKNQRKKVKISAPSKKKRRHRGKGAKDRKVWIIAGSIIAAVIVVYLCVSAFFISHFYINTTINGKDFSGNTVEEVEEYIKTQVEGYKLTLIEMDEKTDVIEGTDINLVYKEDTQVDDALKKQNPLFWISSLFAKSSTKVTINVSYDENSLMEKIQNVQAVTAEQTEPVSAYPKFDGTSFVVEPEVYGTAVDMDVLTGKIKDYITEFKPELDMMEEKCYKLPKYTSDSEEVKKACDSMNQYCKASITYPMKENVVVDKALISTWLSYDENMQVTFNEDAVREWMRQFGATYDTVGATRTITSPNGKTVQVSGGTYGWSVDEETETQNLINSIKNGEVVQREPAYAQTAASHGVQDWGTTYLEVDLSAQYMWYIVDGSIALQCDVVTGLPTPERATPSGVYSILYTQRNATLVGEKDPETGKPIYETPVSYWMPFTYQGHGFHDAVWQSSFGGSRYQTAGSHGCVNMSLDQAANLYSMLSAGTPVIIHY